MNTRSALTLTLAASSLLLATPVRAAEDLPAPSPDSFQSFQSFQLARADAAELRANGEQRRAAKRQDDNARGYGYGYERRQRTDRPDDMGGREQPEFREFRTSRETREQRPERNRDRDRPARRNQH